LFASGGVVNDRPVFDHDSLKKGHMREKFEKVLQVASGDERRSAACGAEPFDGREHGVTHAAMVSQGSVVIADQDMIAQ
jgi:hypothetical protein